MTEDVIDSGTTLGYKNCWQGARRLKGTLSIPNRYKLVRKTLGDELFDQKGQTDLPGNRLSITAGERIHQTGVAPEN